MATNTSVNSPLSGTTGTGNFVGATSPTVTTPTINGSALKQTLSNTTFTGATALSNGYYTQNATYTELAGYDFIDAGGSVPFARIAAYKTGAGSIIKMGTSNSYGSGVTNTAVTIDQSGVMTLSSALPVGSGGTGATSATAYAVICGGTTSTGAHQSIASVGTSGQVLTSNGAGALPTFQNAVAAATQAEQETATSTTTYVSPGRQQFHPSAAKFWVAYSATPTIDVSYNVSSISSVGTGLVQVNFTTSFSSSAYSIAAVTTTASFSGCVFVQSGATGNCQLQAVNTTTGAGTNKSVSAVGFGDQ